MAAKAVEFSVDARQFHDLVAATKAFDPALEKELRKNLRVVATRGTKAVKAELGGSRTGLRSGLARGLRVKVATGRGRSGVYIRATSSGVRPDQAPLVLAFNRVSFRHPVFASGYRGHRGLRAVGTFLGHDKQAKALGRSRDRRSWRWVEQKGHPYFDVVLDRMEPQFRAAVMAALDAAAMKIGNKQLRLPGGPK